MTFPCTGCGQCCRRIAIVKQNAPDFPFSAKPDGSCEKLNGDKCSIYDTRPDICRVDRMAELAGTDKRQFYELNAAACNAFIKEAGLDERFLVTIPQG